jgi:hypothetical protein
MKKFLQALLIAVCITGLVTGATVFSGVVAGCRVDIDEDE